MTDMFSTQKRTEIMRMVRAKHSLPEKQLRSLIHRMGYRFRLHRRDLPGTPDLVFPKYHRVIFMHSCFFHGHKGCKRSTLPDTRREFWERKIATNIKRDHINYAKLKEIGWGSLVVWQCEIKKSTENILKDRITAFLHD